jgi:hypothetical protein
LIVAIIGSRSLKEYNLVQEAVIESGFDITTVVSGGAGGVDRNAKRYAHANNLGYIEFLADWDDISVQGAVLGINKYNKKYNKLAGFFRNQKIIDAAGAVIAIHNGSPGTKDSLKRAKLKGIPVFEKTI